MSARPPPAAPTTRARPAAFSLIEVMVAASILMAGVAALLTAWASIRASYAHQRNLARATNLSASAVDQLAVAYQGSPLLEANRSDVLFSADLHGNPVRINPYFVTTCTVEPNRPIPGMKNVACATNWNDGRPHVVSVGLYRE